MFILFNAISGRFSKMLMLTVGSFDHEYNLVYHFCQYLEAFAVMTDGYLYRTWQTGEIFSFSM